MKTATSFRGAHACAVAPVFLATLALALQTLNSGAQTFLLSPPGPTGTGDNTHLTVNTTGGNLVQDWSVNGFNILNSAAGGFQGLYYSVAGGVATPIQTGIGAASSFTSGSGDIATLNTTYGGSSTPFSLQAAYTLTGGQVGSPNADLTEDVTVKNNQATALNFHFFQYANFTVPNGTVSLQTTLFRGTPLYTLAQVGGGPVSLSEYVDGTLNPGAPAGTITPDLVALTTIPGFALPGPAVNISGPGSAWMLEWDVMIQPGQNFILSKDLYASVNSPAPEPGVVSLLSLGFLAFGGFRFYRRCLAR